MSTIEKALGKHKLAYANTKSISSKIAEAQFEDGGSAQFETTGLAALGDASPFVPVPDPMDKVTHPTVTIPFEQLQSAGYLTPAAPRGTTAEEFRTIKRPLLQNIASLATARIPNVNLVMVTSALEGDGKTFCSLNLAISIAMEQDKTVLFIDADVLKATAGKVLGVPHDTPGLIDILMGDIREPEDAILHTSMDKLRILPAGTPHPNATELLAGSTMHHLMQELSSRYPDRVIVFDSPPLLLTTESRVLANFMGQIVFVASANATPEHAVTEALRDISKDKMVAVMLNKVPRYPFNLFGLGHSYGYGYGYRRSAYSSAAEARGR